MSDSIWGVIHHPIISVIVNLIFVVSALHEEVFSRKLSSFCSGPVDIFVEFGASLFGGGLIWFDDKEVCLGYLSVDLSTLGFGEDSSFQNLCEFLVAILGIIGAIRLHGNAHQPIHVGLRGDSVTALTWVETGRVHSSPP